MATSESTALLPTPRHKKAKRGARESREASAKLDTFSGVFVPTTLNVLSILMFLRFGFIIGQMGIAGTMGLLVLSYFINGLTVMSISAISTNGTVKGGGAYYMISRSLGPEFGGAIGIIFCLGQILNAALNVVGLIEPMLVNFGADSGVVAQILPVGYWYKFGYSSVVLFLCTSVAMVGAQLVSQTGFYLFIILFLSTISVPISAIFKKPFYPLSPPWEMLKYTGLSWETFRVNLWPQFTAGAAGSMMPPGVKENFRNLFGIFFPATAGIFAGASMSGELKNPSKSIPEGTIKGLTLTFVLYTSVILAIGSSTPRSLLHHDIGIIQTINLHSLVVISGEVATSLFSVIMGIVSAAAMLTAIAGDRIVPGLDAFSRVKKSAAQKTWAGIYSIMGCWILAQVCLFADINQIATFITMAFLMTFIVTNMACWLLRIGSAPNFRPSFRYFSSKTAGLGVIMCLVAMFIVDGLSATLIIFFLLSLILVIHYCTPPSHFGDISQLLIYHQVRKYLLRLKLQMSVKYWRPQILLLVDSPRTSWNLIGFCNHLKKGGLYILGHVVISDNQQEDTVTLFKEVKKQKLAWTKLRDMLSIKAFVQIAWGPSLAWGVRNVYLGSGLGGMRPNITVLGFYDFAKHGLDAFSASGGAGHLLPTDSCRSERKVSIAQWVQIVEDLVIMQATVAVAANFGELQLPTTKIQPHHFWQKYKKKMKLDKSKRRFIDLYPIQMSSINQRDDGKSVLSTNFDTYTLILQLGAILATVDEWKYNYQLRVIAFVETTSEIDEEYTRLASLLESLRIDAVIRVIALDDGTLSCYNFIVKGYNRTPFNMKEFNQIDAVLRGDQWWRNLCNARDALREIDRKKVLRQQSKVFLNEIRKPETTKFTPLDLGTSSTVVNYGSTYIDQSNPMASRQRRATLSNLQQQGMSLSFKSAGGYFPADNDSDSESESEEPSECPTPQVVVTESPALVGRSSPPPSSPVVEGSSPLSEGDQVSLRSSVSNLRPNFSAVKIPEAQVANEEEDNDDDDAKPSIQFKEEGEDPLDKPEEEGEKELMISVPSSRSRGSSNSKKPPRTIINNSEINDQLRTPQFLAQEDDDLDAVPSLPSLDSPKKPPKRPTLPRTQSGITQRQLQEELKGLTFSDLPAKGQHLILNQLMKKVSPRKETEVIFSTLPAPIIGTHKSDHDSVDYTHNLAVWFEGLPPTLLFNSQTVTVTTNL
ncbi:vacuolar cation-chloride cotransporter 1 [Diutina catenulata]